MNTRKLKGDIFSSSENDRLSIGRKNLKDAERIGNNVNMDKEESDHGFLMNVADSLCFSYA